MATSPQVDPSNSTCHTDFSVDKKNYLKRTSWIDRWNQPHTMRQESGAKMQQKKTKKQGNHEEQQANMQCAFMSGMRIRKPVPNLRVNYDHNR